MHPIVMFVILANLWTNGARVALLSLVGPEVEKAFNGPTSLPAER